MPWTFDSSTPTFDSSHYTFDGSMPGIPGKRYIVKATGEKFLISSADRDFTVKRGTLRQFYIVGPKT
jgi:hypothetical protein